jgi:hypothetical protein
MGSSFDDSQTASNGLTVREVEQAISLSSIGSVELLGFDACLMACIEQGYEARTVADVLVGSVLTENGAGWDYGALLSQFSNATAKTTESLASAIVDTYGSYYGADQTLSAIDLTAVTSAINAFTQVMQSAAAEDWSNVTTALGEAYHANDNYGANNSNLYVDLGSFMQCLQTLSSNPAVDSATGVVIQELDNAPALLRCKNTTFKIRSLRPRLAAFPVIKCGQSQDAVES